MLYDKQGDRHYDYISAWIKATRGSDPDASLYYLAVMLEGGEDPRFIVRRMVILASEDIGNADPEALAVATAAAAAVEHVGLPEARYALAQAAIYLALAPKSDAAGRALSAARRTCASTARRPSRPWLALGPRPGVSDRGGYENPHRHPGHVAAQELVPEAWSGRASTSPTTPRPSSRERLRADSPGARPRGAIIARMSASPSETGQRASLIARNPATGARLWHRRRDARPSAIDGVVVATWRRSNRCGRSCASPTVPATCAGWRRP